MGAGGRKPKFLPKTTMSWYSKKPQPISRLLKDFVEKHPAQEKLKRGMVLSAFPSIAGERIMAHVEDFHLKGDKLFVKVENQSWRQELYYQRHTIREKLNKRVKAEIVRDIIFR